MLSVVYTFRNFRDICGLGGTSRHETWRTRKYWESLGSLLIEESQAIPRSPKHNIGKRLIDGIVVLGEERKIQIGGKYNFAGKDIVVIQTKASRLGM